jgi:anti-sigma B factor antagonist
MSSTQPSYDPQWAAGPPGLNCASYPDGPGFTRVRLSGELDLATAPQLAGALAEVPDGTAVVILDLSELTFMDSTGLHLVVSARARLAEAGCRLVLVPGGRQVQRIFEITGTKHHLEFISAPNARDLALVRSR